MKLPTHILPSLACATCLLFSSYAVGQGEQPASVSEITAETISSKGTHLLGLHRFMGLSFTGNRVEGDKFGNSSMFNVASTYGYNITDNVNIYGSLGYARNGFQAEGINGSQVQSTLDAKIGAWYIAELGGKNLFIGGAVGGGPSTFKDEFSGSTSEVTADRFNYELAVKYPILLNDGHAYAAHIAYVGENESVDDFDRDFSGINAGVSLYNFNLDERIDGCHKDAGASFSNGMYSKGQYYVGGDSRLNIRVGNYIESQSVGELSFTYEEAETSLGLDYLGRMYLDEGLAVEGAFDFDYSKFCALDSETSSRSSYFGLTASALYHIPQVSEDFYGKVELGAGSFGFTDTDFSGDEISDSEGRFQWGVGAGYYHFIAPRLALNPELKYGSISQGDPTLNTSGLYFNIGLVANLDF